MAISVRLPQGKGPYIEHYLIEADQEGRLSLESSDNKFHSIPALIAHYAQCCDELPVQLSLPRIIREAKNRQQLSSLALLGQEFWRYPMANPRPTQLESCPQQQGEVGPASSLPSSQASSLSSFSSGSSPPPPEPAGPLSFLPPRAPRPTPPNTLNLISSTTSGKVGVTPVGKTPPPPPPRWSKPNQPSNFTVTTTVTFSMTEMTTSTSPILHHPQSIMEVGSKMCQYEQREGGEGEAGRVGGASPPHGSSPPCSSPPLGASPPRLTSPPATSSPLPCLVQSAVRAAPLPASPTPSSITSPTPSSITSPTSESAKPPPHRRSKRHKESSHYQESDILESPTVYCRSSIADKVSDYEDIWGPESLTTFKPVLGRRSPEGEVEGGGQEGGRHVQEPARTKVPDILDRVPPCPAPRPSLRPPSPLTPSPTDQPPLTPTEQCVGETGSGSKQSSPFYCEPADAIRSCAEVTRRRPHNRPPTHRSNRHSDPATLLQWPSIAYPGALERIDSKEELITSGLSSSVDNLAILKRAGRRIGLQEKNSRPTKQKQIKRPHNKKSYSENSWTVDSSWEFIGNDDEGGSEPEECPEERTERKFPSLEQQETESPVSKGITVQELIAQRLPELRLPGDVSRSGSTAESGSKTDCLHSSSRVSAYDNVTSHRPSNGLSTQSHLSDDDTQTVFSEPWDSSRWETLLEKCDDWRADDRNSIIRNKSFKERLDPLLSGPRLQALQKTRDSCTGGGATIRAYALHLAADKSTVFAQTIDNFIACTKESRESRPHVVMRNMRQFMSGMKNYLVKHGEREFVRLVERERGKLRANEFLNLDAILEGVMHKLVVRPLKEHLFRLFVAEYTDSGAIQLLADNIHYARTKPLHELGIRSKIIPPCDDALDRVCSYLHRLQEVDSPLEKLENLLACIAAIFNSVKVENACLGADDFLPLFVWVLVQSGMVSAEIEAEYMWGLLHPSLLSGEGGYYLTTLSSAVHVLKSFRASLDPAHTPPLGSGPEFRSVLKIVVPDEMNGSIITKTLPVRPNMTTRDVCKIIAHKVRITNPQDYGLYKLIDGEETLLNDGDCPQDVKGLTSTSGKHCMFAYKRIDAKIAWPINTN